MRPADLIAVQPFMRLADYGSEETFRTKIESLMERVDEARGGRVAGRFPHPALVVFPENIGTFLGVAGHYTVARHAATTDGALTRVLLRKLPELVRTMVRFRLRDPKRAALLLLSSTVWPIYFRTFSELARKHQAWIVAGSALVARNRRGRDSYRYEPRDADVWNLSLTFDPDGWVVNETRKVNLVPTLEDVLGLTPGCVDDLEPFDTPMGRVGTMICYDGFAEPHTANEPRFRTVGAHYDSLDVRILAQPAANPWPWDERWVFADPGEDQLRREQWLNEGLCCQLAGLGHVRWAVNPQLIGQIFDNRFDGRSYVFERTARGQVRVLAEARDYRLAPESEEIVVARVDLDSPQPE